MIKVVLLDADGCVIKKRERLFSERLAEKCGVLLDDVLPFFKHDMRLAFVDKADIKIALAAYFPKWHWQGSVDDFLAYWFGEESPRDEAVIAYVQELRKAGMKCYLSTDRERYWGEYLKKEVGLAKELDGFMYSYELGYQKHEPEYFTAVAKRVGLQANEIMYWDDDQKNVDVASSVGIDAHLHENLEGLQQGTAQFLNHHV